MVKIEHAIYQLAKMFGQHFDEKNDLLSHITHQSIDVLKVLKLNAIDPADFLESGLKNFHHIT